MVINPCYVRLQGGNTFESVNDPRSYEFGFPPFLMHGVGLWAASEEEAKKVPF